VVRRYNHKEDGAAALSIFKEIGWFEKGKNREKDAASSAFFRSCRSWVAELRGRVEAIALTNSGELRYLDEDLPLCCVTGVITSPIARKQGFASRTTAEAVADAAEDGMAVAALGVFEQGFYNRLGFGSGSYEHWIGFDPATLKVGSPEQPPWRLTTKDWQAVHASMLARMRRHGSCNIFSAQLIRMDMAHAKNGFGLGYYRGKRLTHHLWLSSEGGERGPIVVYWMAFENYSQFLELMSLLKSIGDQYHLVELREPPGVQFQDLLRQPFKSQRMTRKSQLECRSRAAAYWQMRILDLDACIAKTRLAGGPLHFNLELEDPICSYLQARRCWRGISGRYVVTLGQRSEVREGREENMPTLKAEVGAFTRLWLGSLKATSLAALDRLSGPPELLESIDALFTIAAPHPDWDF